MRARRSLAAQRLLWGTVAGLSLCGSGALAGGRALFAAEARQASASAAQDLPAGRRALAAGQFDNALRIADALIVQTPVNRDAVALKVDSLLALMRLGDALGAYDAYVTAARKQDPELLKTIAIADLGRIIKERQNDSMLVAAALERLALGGDAAALRTLKQMASNPAATTAGLAPALSLARLADAETRANLGKLLEAAPADTRILLIKTIQDAGATGQAAAVAARLGDPEPAVRSAAALALGVLQYKTAIPRLQAAFNGDLPIVKMNAGLALKRLGDPTADAFVAQLLKSEIPEVRLVAAEAFQGTRSQEWLTLVRSLRTDANEVTRIRAATVMACCEPATARALLLEELKSQIPLVRLEAARALETKGLGDAALARRLLGDTFDPVQISGAGMAIAPARPPR